jgi:HD-GYP domain-containing protein (c-di-GMP phosphodiesterase class II)
MKPVNSIPDGSIIAKSVYNSRGVVLLRAGFEWNHKLKDILYENGIYSLYVHDRYSDQIIDDVISDTLRRSAVNSVKNTFKVFNKGFSSQKKITKQTQNSFDDMLNTANTLVENILNQKDILINLVDIKNMDDYTYQHCINVAILAIVVGIERKYSHKVLSQIALGCMLHDFGKSFIPNHILNKPGKLTEEEMETMKTHSQIGYEYLKSFSRLTGLSLSIIRDHHERKLGQGYPRQLIEKDISEYASLGMVCDVYDALTSDRPYRLGFSPNEAIEFLYAGAADEFDVDIINSFTKCIAPYPPGSVVVLNNNQIAVVDKVNKQCSLRPTVKLIDITDNFGNPMSINLIDCPTLVIKGLSKN